jgi:hypothetical protein
MANQQMHAPPASTSSAFYRFLEQALTLGKKGIRKSALPRFVGFLSYLALVGLLATSILLNLGPQVIASAIVLLMLVGIMSVLLLWDIPKIRPVIFEIILLLVVCSFLAVSAFAVYKWLESSTPNGVDARKPKYDDPVKAACMDGSIVDCQNYAGSIRVKCNPFDASCKLLATCWDDKVRALQVVDFACNTKANAESCDFQRKNMRGMLKKDCDKVTLGNF